MTAANACEEDSICVACRLCHPTNKERIQAFLDENSAEAWECWKNIESPKDKFLAFVRIMEFIVPKMASVELKGDKEVPDWMKKLEEIRKI